MTSHTTLKATISPMFDVIKNLENTIISVDAAYAAAVADEEATMLRIAKLEAKYRVYSKYLKADKNILGVKRKNEADLDGLVGDSSKKSRNASTSKDKATRRTLDGTQKRERANASFSKKGETEE